MSYVEEFRAAASRTARWGLGEFALGDADSPLDRAILNELEASSHIPFGERAGKAMTVNFGMFHMLVKKYNMTGCVITMGSVSVEGRALMDAPPARFKSMLAEQSGEENLGSYHLWTTLPGGVILDHAILSSLHREGLAEINPVIPSERVVCAPADALPHGLAYHPAVVGEEFLVASGTIDREAMDYLMGGSFPKQY
ncbi:hypothetical protein GKC30_00470 [Pseudodesulfovibrio sp. F-1]|uniref:Uncharacterized protein n=1 Tax=Pseudodesulfovibrio alkaliphilus TaxID=2661613 RepID=A0A7K1KJ42_9BACT|nr:hypothetical protein [Pseudodesulfovibrio alkaliphilus]MUM76103.1 hypothetical protein [Pseudodesulfovibrio alkaliphilus]